VAANPVHTQVKTVAESMGAQPSEAEAYILGGQDAPEVMEPREEFAAKYPATETVRTASEMPLAQPEKKSGWSLFGRKKAATPDMRVEPKTAPRPAPRAEPAAPADAASTSSGEDLFPDHGRDEQFEIPAFLRRQSN
jgi:hypothetical protein